MAVKAIALVMPLSIAACNAADEPSWLLAEARSPRGDVVARLWCPDRCDVPEKTMLTISPASTKVDVAASDVEGFPPQGELPYADIAATLYEKMENGIPATITWTGNSELTFAVSCPTDGNYRAAGSGIRFRGIAVAFRNNAPTRKCK